MFLIVSVLSESCTSPYSPLPAGCFIEYTHTVIHSIIHAHYLKICFQLDISIIAHIS